MEQPNGLTHVALDVLGHEGHVADPRGVGRRRRAADVIQSPCGGGEMAGGADAADPRGDHQPVQGTAALQDALETAIHGPAAVGVDDHAVVELHPDLQVPLDAVHRDIDGQLARHA
jgi:hypothetical protein